LEGIFPNLTDETSELLVRNSTVLRIPIRILSPQAAEQAFSMIHVDEPMARLGLRP
jgi:hypothetical protein